MFTVPMPNPNGWNALQAHILLRLAEGAEGKFDRWNKLCLDDKPVTSGNSTTPYTLFRRGLIVSDGETVFITDRGITFLTETIGLSFEQGRAIVKSY
jgi:hypothetical protein